jgi:hypothetical protein
MGYRREWRSWRGRWGRRDNFSSADYIDEHGLKKQILWQDLWNPRDLRKRSLADWPMEAR